MFGLSGLLQWAGELNGLSGTKGAKLWSGPPLRRESLQFEQLEDRRMLSLLGQQLFPSDYPWNQDISTAPVAANSANVISHIGASVPIHPDWGADNPANGASPLYGIPYNVVHGKSTTKINVIIDNYPGESDIVPVPIPANAVVEGDYQNGPNLNGGGYKTDQRGDSHLIVWDEDNNIAYELYGAIRPSDPTLFPTSDGTELPHTDNQWHAAQETVWHMNADQFRTLGYTSADAAGLSILAGLARPDEGLTVAQGGQGAINHALRMTLPASDINPQYIYPGSHMVSTSPGSNNLPLGARLRLKNNATVNNIINGTSSTPAMPPESQIIARAMQKYGLVVADIGSAMFVTGTSASIDANNNISKTWDLNDITASNGLRQLIASYFEVVNLRPIITGISATSGVANSTLLISGQNFSGAAGNLSVYFGSVASNSVTVVSDTQLSVLVPSGVGTVNVTVQSGLNEVDNVSSDPNANVNAPIFGYGTASAGQFTFTGGEAWTNGALSLKWTDALNWSPSGVPSSTTDAIFANAGLSSGTTVNLNGAQTARSLALQGSVSFTLGGNGSLTLSTGFLTRSPGTSGTQTIAHPVILGANGTWYIAGSGQLVVASAVSGPFSLTKQNAGTLTLSGSNTYSHGTIVLGGTLVVSNQNALLSGSSLTVGSDASSVFGSAVAATQADTLLLPLTSPQAQLIVRQSESEDGRPLPRLPVTLESDGKVDLASSVSGVSAPALPRTDVVKTFPAGAANVPRIDPFSRSSAGNTIAADLAWLQGGRSSDDLGQSRGKDVAIMALEALFADYGG